MKKMMAVFCLLCGAGLVMATGFQERFALAEDRAAVLDELLPGSDDSFYYRALHHLNEGEYARFKTTMRAWKRELKSAWPNRRARELLNREALLRYADEPRSSLEYLRAQLGLHFNHSRKDASRAPNLPTSFDNRVIDTQTLLRDTLKRRDQDIHRIESRADGLLARADLTAGQRLELLKRLDRPDYQGLVDLIAADMKERRGTTFGSLKIHSLLTQAQLDELAKRRPDLWRSEIFVNTYIARLVPIDEVDMTKELDQRHAYYARVWEKIKNLIPDFNSRKANLLYNWLRNDLRLGRVDPARFIEYLKYPRAARYAPRMKTEQRAYALDFRKQYGGGSLPAIGNEEPLVRKILLRLLRDAPDYSAFAPYLKKEFLREVFAEAKITSGQGKPEDWVGWMSRSKYDALKRRVDVDFVDDNPVTLALNEPVALSAYIKNVKSLIVKIYEINTLNCYRETGAPVDLAMNLNGLTATFERRHEYTQSALSRVRREFTFPELQQRGVYIIELIGNGRSSRALVRRGHLKVVEQITAGGHAFTVFDEELNQIRDCAGWFNGAELKARKDGRIYVPFASPEKQEAEKQMVVAAGRFAALKKFRHLPEKYTLKAGFYVDREALIAGERAEVAVRPALLLNSQRVALSLLDQLKLTITSVDLDGVESKSVVADFKLNEEAEFAHKFRVPERCARLRFSLGGKVENLALNQERELLDSRVFAFNSSERGKNVNHLFLGRHRAGYFLEVRGKNGEVAPEVPVNLHFKHRLFKSEIAASLKSDKSGVIELGALKEIQRFRGSWDGVENRISEWVLDQSGSSFVSALNGGVGEPLYLPVADNLNPKEDLSLLELRGGRYVKDWNSALSCGDGLVKIENLPAGDYCLKIARGPGGIVPVCVTKGKATGDLLISERTALERPKLRPLSIASVKADQINVRVALANPSKYTRVHIVADRYLPEFSLFDALVTDGVASPLNKRLSIPGCHYESGRDIGDEYRYVLERQHLRRYPGNMLERPGLLIAPWSKSKTDAEKESLADEGAYKSVAEKVESADARRSRGLDSSKRRETGSAVGSIDFLKKSSAALYNLKPDQEGMIEVPLEALKGKPYLRIVASDPQTLVVREFTLPATPVATRELRLSENLNPEVGFMEQQRSTVLKQGDLFEIKGADSAKFEVYDSVSRLYALFTALSGDATLKKFAFITEWHTFDDTRKRELYSEFASHELNLFLYFKDPAFFNKVVKSFIANKRDKRFVDQWLLGNDLAEYCSGLARARLNAAESALLAQRVAAGKNLIARDLRERVELLPIDQERLNRLFDTALRGRSLAATQAIGGEAGAAGFGVGKGFESVKSVKSPVISSLRLAAKNGAPKSAVAPRAKRRAEVEESGAKRKRTMDDPFAAGVEARQSQRRLFQKLERAKEWAENNYYKLPIEEQGAELIKANIFWQEYAEHQGERGFVSGKVAEAAGSFAEMMLALAVTDLPLEARGHTEERQAGSYKLIAASPVLIYHRQVRRGARADQGQALVAQRFFRLDDRYRYQGNERHDKIVTTEFLKRVVYGAQVLLTNPTGGRLKLRLLLQIPRGAIPVLGGFHTKGFYVSLEPYATYKREYFFYFPRSGRYAHYPVAVARDQQVTAQARPFVFNVVDKLSDIDKESWVWIAHNGGQDDVITYLRRKNIHRVALDEIAWRMKERDFFIEVIGLLSERGAYNSTLWSYALRHNLPKWISEYLERTKLADASGLWIDAPILKIDPIERNFYEHLEYAPLVNPRAHKVGREHKIMNTRFRANYEKFMKVLSYKPALTAEDQLAIVWAMTLQDRIGEAVSRFDKVDRQRIVEQIQYDYLEAYLAFYQNDVKRAERIASGYAKYHVDHWREKFALILAQAEEIQGEAAMSVVDRRDRDQAQSALAATEPALEMKVESGIVKLRGANITECTLNFYPMDIELLFSRSPFVEAGAANFSLVRPALSQPVAMAPDNLWLELKLPRRFASKNVMIEAVASGVRRTRVCYANTLDVRMVERYGQLSVRHAESAAPLPAVYVKVYAMINGEVSFFKDGYTDPRGRFDYVSLNSAEIARVDKLAVLIMSDTLGAVVREARPPDKTR